MTTATAPSPTTASVTSTVPSAWTPAVWAAAVLAAAGVPVTQNNVNNITHWIPAENYTNNWWATTRNNPLNAYTGGFGHFSTLGASAVATGQLLKSTYSGTYGHQWTVLDQTGTLSAFSHAVVASTWAGGHYGGTPTHLTTTSPTPSYAAPSTKGNPVTSLATVTGTSLTSVTSNSFWGKVATILGHLPTPTNPNPFSEVAPVYHAAGGKGLTGIVKDLTRIGKDIGYLHDLAFWKRVGIFLGGGALLGVGIFLLAQGNSGVRKVESTAAVAAVA